MEIILFLLLIYPGKHNYDINTRHGERRQGNTLGVEDGKSRGRGECQGYLILLT
jgi:hypothetical protein